MRAPDDRRSFLFLLKIHPKSPLRWFHIPSRPCITLNQGIMYGEGTDLSMKDYIEERVIKTAEYIVENGATVRAAAKVFGTSKSTTHKDLIERLPHINRELSAQVNHILAVNKAERHIRGGQATCLKYQQQRLLHKV
jgi:putative DeoR family transcriptional regulator (stage III sporulation protein D)